MIAPIRCLQVISLDQRGDGITLVSGMPVRLDLGDAKPHEVFGDTLEWLGWMAIEASFIEITGSNAESIQYVRENLPGAIKRQRWEP